MIDSFCLWKLSLFSYILLKVTLMTKDKKMLKISILCTCISLFVEYYFDYEQYLRVTVTIIVHSLNTYGLKRIITPIIADELQKVRTVAALMQSALAPLLLFITNRQ